jgi:hypothetical protein
MRGSANAMDRIAAMSAPVDEEEASSFAGFALL